jgi:hypothetical protein
MTTDSAAELNNVRVERMGSPPEFSYRTYVATMATRSSAIRAKIAGPSFQPAFRRIKDEKKVPTEAQRVSAAAQLGRSRHPGVDDPQRNLDPLHFLTQSS